MMTLKWAESDKLAIGICGVQTFYKMGFSVMYGAAESTETQISNGAKII